MTNFVELSDFIEIWDLIDGSATLYLPILPTEKGQAKSVFFETFINEDKDQHVVARVFLSAREAQDYLKKQDVQGMRIAKVGPSVLYNAFESFFGKKTYSKTFECVLSSTNGKNELRELDILWTNKFNA
jgi:hypothetical protein